jgi:hypothetical protein
MTHSDPSQTPNSQPPKDPKVNDHWIDDAGDVWIWDGSDWMPPEDIPPFTPTSTLRPDQ